MRSEKGTIPMEMQQVRYFVALADTLNFTRAAEKCNVSQPALTRAIQQLEHEFGGPLFHRERGNTHLSELGRMMLPYLQTVEEQTKAARELLIAQASDWQFIISTGEVADYATRRFNVHCDDLERLLMTLKKGGNLESGLALAEELRLRDDVFPNILPTLERIIK